MTSKICALYVTFYRKQSLHWHFYRKLKWVLIYGSSIDYWYRHIFYSNFSPLVSTEIKLWFWSSLEHFFLIRSIGYIVRPKLLCFWKKYTVFKNRVQCLLKHTFHPCFDFVCLVGILTVKQTTKQSKKTQRNKQKTN